MQSGYGMRKPRLLARSAIRVKNMLFRSGINKLIRGLQRLCRLLGIPVFGELKRLFDDFFYLYAHGRVACMVRARLS